MLTTCVKSWRQTTPKPPKKIQHAHRTATGQKVCYISLRLKIRTMSTPSSPTPAAPAKTRKYRRKSATVAKREIKKYQTSTKAMIPRRCFNMLVREIAESYKCDLRFSADAFHALQEAAEEHVTKRMRRAGRQCQYAGRTTIMPSDLSDIGADTFQA